MITPTAEKRWIVPETHRGADVVTSVNCGNHHENAAGAVFCATCGVPIAAGGSQSAGIRMRPNAIVALLGAASLALGSFLPWATIVSIFGVLSVYGTDGDGKITLATGVVAALAFFLGTSNRKMIGVGIVAAIAGSGVAIYDLAHISNVVGKASNNYGAASVGIGVYFCTLGGVVAVVFGLMSMPKGN